MAKKRKFIFIIIALCCISIFSACKKKPDEVLLANYIVKEYLTTNQDSIEINELIDTLLDETIWKGKIRINKTYDPVYVNIIIIDGNSAKVKSDDKAYPLIGNCLFVGYNIIFLDDAYLRSFLQNHHVVLDPHTTELKDDQECFLYWVIGHELGHLVNGDLHGHFDSGSLDRFVKTSSLENKEELRADSFFVQATISRRMLRFSEQRLMMNILNAEIEQKVGKIQTAGVGIIYDYTNQYIVTYARQSTHPEYVIRLSRMLELSSKMGHDTGLYNLVGGFIKQLKEVK